MNVLNRLNGTNYEDQVESLKLFLVVSNMDMALIEDGPLTLTSTSSIVDKSRYDKQVHSNKVCLMTMRPWI